MLKKLVKVMGLFIMIAMVATVSLWSVGVYADVTTECVFMGQVTLDGNPVPANSTVTASINGAGQWSGAVNALSQYAVHIPEKTGSVAGGVNGAIVNFKVNINGRDYTGINGIFQKTSNIILNQRLITPPIPVINTASLPDGTEDVAYSATLAASGGTTPYAWSATGLPPGLTIAAATGAISGAPGNPGDFAVVISARDSAATPATGTRNYTLHVNAAIPAFAITTPSLADARQGVVYSMTLAAVGGIPPYIWTSTALPGGLVIAAATGIISGNATVSGNFSITVTVTDAAFVINTTSRTYNLQILPAWKAINITTLVLPRWQVEVFPAVPPSSWLPLPLPGWIVGQGYNATMTASEGNGVFTWNATNLPPGLVISASGVVSGTPTTEGLYDIVFNVSDGQTPPFTKTVTLQLKIYFQGDATGNDDLSIADVTYAERAILGLNAPTAGCDANLSGSLSIADVTKIERLILGLP